MPALLVTAAKVRRSVPRLSSPRLVSTETPRKLAIALECGDLQVREGVLLDDVNVPGGDSATGIDIVTEVRACDGLKSLRLTQIGVATGNHAAGVYVANEYTHCRGKVADVTCC